MLGVSWLVFILAFQRDWLLEWLTQRGWLHEVNAAGRPIILRNYAENRLSGRKPNQPTNPPAIVPNFAAIKNTPPRCNKR